MKAVLVANPKGGCGKTTVATNLAGALAARGDRVYLWDLDRQKSALEWLSMRPTTLPGIRRLDARMPNDDAVDGKPVWMVLDSPAALHGKNLGHALKAAHKVLVPLQPSLVRHGRDARFRAYPDGGESGAPAPDVRRHRRCSGGSANQGRGDPEAFLAQYELPVLAFLRDTQLYPNAAFTGLSLFDFPPSLVERDVEQWTRILDWIATVPAV